MLRFFFDAQIISKGGAKRVENASILSQPIVIIKIKGRGKKATAARQGCCKIPHRRRHNRRNRCAIGGFSLNYRWLFCVEINDSPVLISYTG
jgi:hypothetical protein